MSETHQHDPRRGRELIGRALTGDDDCPGGLTGAFALLQVRLELYAAALTDEDRDDIRNGISLLVDQLFLELGRSAPLAGSTPGEDEAP